jgi:hypothetical protein
MKKLFFFVLLLPVALTVLSQEIIKDRTYYLTRSKNQRSAARVLLLGGGGVLLAAVIIGNAGDPSFDALGTYAIIGGCGTAAMLGSIPLFIAAGKNKKKGMALSAFFKTETSPVIVNTGTKSRQYPVIGLKVVLR